MLRTTTTDLAPIRKNPRLFTWGTISKFHEIGPYTLVEYVNKQRGGTVFHVYIDGKCTSTSAATLEGGLLIAMARKHLEVNDHEDVIARLRADLAAADATAQTNAELASAWAIRWASLRKWITEGSASAIKRGCLASDVLEQMKTYEGGESVSPEKGERSSLERGDRFTQTRSGREMVVADPEYEDGMVSFYYADTGPSDWFYCCVEEVIIFTGSYTRLPNN